MKELIVSLILLLASIQIYAQQVTPLKKGDVAANFSAVMENGESI